MTKLKAAFPGILERMTREEKEAYMEENRETAKVFRQILGGSLGELSAGLKQAVERQAERLDARLQKIDATVKQCFSELKEVVLVEMHKGRREKRRKLDEMASQIGENTEVLASVERNVLWKLNDLDEMVEKKLESINRVSQSLTGLEAVPEVAKGDDSQRDEVGGRDLGVAILTEGKDFLGEPQLPTFDGDRDCLFGWMSEMESYFLSLDLEDGKMLVEFAASFFQGPAATWWRDVLLWKHLGNRGLRTWNDLKAVLCKQFAPVSPGKKIDSRGASRIFSGNPIRDCFPAEIPSLKSRRALYCHRHLDNLSLYISTFEELVVQCDRMSDADKLFLFINGLQPWARTEVTKKEPKNVRKAIKISSNLPINFSWKRTATAMFMQHGAPSWTRLQRALGESGSYLTNHPKMCWRIKLHGLLQTGGVEEYVAEFTSLAEECHDMDDVDKMYLFVSGLQEWNRKQIQLKEEGGLDRAIELAKQLPEIKPEGEDAAPRAITPVVDLAKGRKGKRKRKGKGGQNSEAGGNHGASCICCDGQESQGGVTPAPKSELDLEEEPLHPSSSNIDNTDLLECTGCGSHIFQGTTSGGIRWVCCVCQTEVKGTCVEVNPVVSNCNPTEPVDTSLPIESTQEPVTQLNPFSPSRTCQTASIHTAETHLVGSFVTSQAVPPATGAGDSHCLFPKPVAESGEANVLFSVSKI